MINALAIFLMTVQSANASVSFIVPNALIGFFQKTEEFRNSYSVAPGTKMHVYNANGEINISHWAEDYVEVYAKKKTSHGEKELAKIEIEVVIDDVMEIRTKYLEKNARVSVRYDIKVPKGVVVEEVKTSNGEIELSGTSGDVTMMTSNGEIHASDVMGTVSAQTSNGEIEIRRTAAVTEANTSNGEIIIEVNNIPEGGTHIASSNGSIDVYIADDVDADLSAATSFGKIRIRDVELRSRFSVISQTSTMLTGEIGEGGRLINVSTSNGEIELHRSAR